MQEADEPAELVTAQLNLAKLSSPADESKHISAEGIKHVFIHHCLHAELHLTSQAPMPL